jgi:hypothetical protein
MVFDALAILQRDETLMISSLFEFLVDDYIGELKARAG